MENIIFSFGVNCHIYNTPSYWSYSGVPANIKDLVEGDKVSDITCAAFGSSRDVYFFAYKEKGDADSFKFTANNLPSKLKAWLTNENDGTSTSRSKHVKVILGTDNSFVAWDSSSIRWSNIPSGMEEAIQGWLSPSGWIAGPPRILTWSLDGSWLAVSEYGQSAWSIPADDEELKKALDEIEDWRLLKCASFHPYRDGIWIIIDANGDWCGKAPIPTRDFLLAAESIDDVEAFKARLAAEAASEQTNGNGPGPASNPAQEALEKAWANVSKAEYKLWKAACGTAFASKGGTLLQFPLLPLEACICILESCVKAKTEPIGSVCKHDLKLVLSCDAEYSTSWLKKERVKWHPDKIQRLSHPDKRGEHKILAERMFDGYQKLYHEESGLVDETPSSANDTSQEADQEDSRASQFESRKDQKRRAAEAKKVKEEAERKQQEEAAQKKRDQEAKEKLKQDEREREEARRKASEAAEKRAKGEASRRMRGEEYRRAKEEADALEKEDRKREAEERMNILQAKMEEERCNLEKLNVDKQSQDGPHSAERTSLGAPPSRQGWEKRWRRVSSGSHDTSGSPGPRWEQYWAPVNASSPPPLPPRRASRSPSTTGRTPAEVAYDAWNLQCLRALAFDSITSLPQLPKIDVTCNRPSCLATRKLCVLDTCVHELRWLLRGSGRYSTEWLLAQAETWESGKIAEEYNSYLGPAGKAMLISQAAELHEMITLLAALEMSKGP